MAVPYTFGSATSSIPLSQLDNNFATAITLGNTAIQLGNTVTTLNNMTLANVTISSGNVTITSVTLANANITGTTTLSGLTASTALALDASKNIVSVTNTGTGNNVLAASPSLTGTVTIATLNLTNALGTTYGGTGLTSFTANGVLYASSSSALTSGSALTFDGTGLLGVGTNATPSHGIKGIVTANTANASGLQLTNNVGGASVGGSLLYATSGDEFQLYTFTGAIGSETYAVRYAITSAGGIHKWNVGASEAMRLTSTGLGIGTSSPAKKLVVQGSTSDRTVEVIDNGSNDAAIMLQLSGVQEFTLGVDRTDSSFKISDSGALGTNDRLILDSSGNLGLGVTPSAWAGSVSYAMQVGNYASVSSSQYYGGAYSSNSYYTFAGGGWKYIANDYATSYQQVSGQHRWLTAASGTAGNTITFSQAMTLDASGNLGVGTTSPNISGQSASVKVVSISGSGNNWGGIELNNPSSGGGSLLGFIGWTGSNMTSGYNMPAYIGTWLASGTSLKQGGELRFHTQSDNTAGATERARIDSSGNILLGTTSAFSNAFTSVYYVPGTTYGIGFKPSTDSNTPKPCSFLNASAAEVGSITTTASLTLFNTTSDQRLKENIQDADSASSLIDSLKVRKFDWKTDQTHQRYGFVAQELVTVAPEAVHQPEDEEQMMAVDYSKLVPMLVKEIQSLRKRLADAGI
jgi:hypothetical protein